MVRDETPALLLAVLAAFLFVAVVTLALQRSADGSPLPPPSPSVADVQLPDIDELCRAAVARYGYRARATGQRGLGPTWWRPIAVATCQAIATEARAAGVPVRLAVSVAIGESNFDPFASRRTGELGPLQVKRYHCRRLIARVCETIEDSISAGVALLAELLDAEDSAHHALEAYRCGREGRRRVDSRCWEYADRTMRRVAWLRDAQAAG